MLYTTVNIPTAIEVIKADAKKIAADVVTITGVLLVVLKTVEAIQPAVHLPANALAAITTAVAVLGTVITEARRIAGAKAAAIEANRSAHLTK